MLSLYYSIGILIRWVSSIEQFPPLSRSMAPTYLFHKIVRAKYTLCIGHSYIYQLLGRLVQTLQDGLRESCTALRSV